MNLEERLVFQEEVILEITESILALMEKEGITREDLAKRLGKSVKYVDKLLNGTFSVRAFADVLYALGHVPVLTFKERKLSNTKEDLVNQPGFVPEMEGMKKIWDRDESPSLVTGVRAVYEAAHTYPCKCCNQPTNRVIDWLGTLMFDCGSDKHIAVASYKG